MFRINQRVRTIPLTIIGYSLILQKLMCKTDNGVDVILPLSINELNIGQYGLLSYIHPTELPYTHPDACLPRDLNRPDLVVHNRTGEVVNLHLHQDFWINGEFTLRPMNSSDQKTCTSIRWTKSLLSGHLNNFKGKTIVCNFHIAGLLHNGKFVDATLTSSSNRSTRKITILVTPVHWLYVFALDIAILDLTNS